MPEPPTTTPTGESARPAPPRRPRSRSQPNYAARRMLVTTIGVTMIVAAGIVGWRALRDDGGSRSGAGGDWDEIALVDRSTGAITTVDDEGETKSTTVGLGRVTAVHAHGDHLALVGDLQIALHQRDEEPIAVPIERNSTVIPIVTADALHLAVGMATGGNVLIIDAATGEVLDVGALAEQADPLLFVETLRWADDASAFAVADARNFQTIVVRPGEETAAFLDDQPVAVGDELVATSQTVGRQADVALLDLERKREAIVPTGIPAGGVMIDDALTMVSIAGEVVRISRGDEEEAEQLGTVAVPAGGIVESVHPTAAGERLVVAGSVLLAVIDLDGNTVFTTTFTNPIDVAPPDPRWSCLPVGGNGGYHSLIALDDGEQLADLTGLEVTGVAGDGCTVIGERAGLTEVVTVDGIVPLGRLRDAVLAPDGRTVVTTTTNGQTAMIRIDDELALGDPIVLDAAPANLTVAFLDR